jgi:hypothetical protein
MLILTFMLIIGIVLQIGGFVSGINKKERLILVLIGFLIEIGCYFLHSHLT